MNVVYEDDVLLVVDKPSGVAVQARKGPTLFAQLQAERDYVGLHHRLDAGASGLLLFTLDASVNAAIASALRDHRIVRGYCAVLDGEASDGSWTTRVDGKSARTDVIVVGRGAGASAVQLTLHTGRKHQIRVQSAMAGTPVLGDRQYGGDAARRWRRLALHAARLELDHPVTGKRIVLDSPVPADLSALWERVTQR